MNEQSTNRPMALTKFEPPALPTTFVSRPALYDSIDEGAGVPVTLVAALPGSGKTATLTGGWTERKREHTVWMSCDALDRDPLTFWSSVITALRGSRRDQYADAFDMVTGPSPDPHDVAVALVNDLVAIAEPTTLILDDFSFAEPAGESLAYFIDRAPPGVCLVLGCRSDPHIELARLRVRGLVREIRQDDLALTLGETIALFAAYGIHVDSKQADGLRIGTDGWGAALQLAALSVRAGSPIDGLLEELSHSRALTDFLVDEVVGRQPSDVRDFVFDTSILEELDAQTCDAIREASQSGHMLDRVADANLLLAPVVANGVYHYR